MPRRQRFKPSRKPKPAIEPSDDIVIQPSGKPTNESETRQMNVGQRADAHEDRHPDDVEDRVPR